MKLSEPLSGIKLIQGHWVMHIALFICSFVTVDTSSYYPSVDNDKELGPQIEIQIFYLLTYGHLVTAILQTLKWIAEVQGYIQFANSIQLTTLFTYLAPLFVGQWLLQNISAKIL